MNSNTFDKYINHEITYEEFSHQANIIREDTSSYNALGLTPSEFELYERLGEDALDNIIKSREMKKEIIIRWKDFFRENIASNHKKNTLKLKNLNEFNLNPFLDTYKANFLLGDSSSKSIATALVYARTLGTSINTSFGTNLQKFCSDILSGYASTTSGIDIEFDDFLDGQRKYCQIKAGPNTINKDDVKTISDHFVAIKNLARTNNLSISFNDLVVGVFYGEMKDLSGHYKKVKDEYPIYIGQDFWYRLTGDPDFYDALTKASAEVASEFDGRAVLDEVITELTTELDKKQAED